MRVHIYLRHCSFSDTKESLKFGHNHECLNSYIFLCHIQKAVSLTLRDN